MAEKKIRNLNPEEIECRVGTVMEQGITLLLYKNARVDQTILDEVFGIFGWQRRHNMIGSELYCILSIWDDEKQQWVQKEDVGTESDYEKAKGAASDSFKRACFNIGIGRELYTAPFIFITASKVVVTEKDRKKVVKDSFSVSAITISADKVITGISVINQKKAEVFRWGNLNAAEKNNGDANEEWQELYRELERTKVPEEQILKRYGVKSLSELDEVSRKRALNGLKRTKSAA